MGSFENMSTLQATLGYHYFALHFAGYTHTRAAGNDAVELVGSGLQVKREAC